LFTSLRRPRRVQRRNGSGLRDGLTLRLRRDNDWPPAVRTIDPPPAQPFVILELLPTVVAMEFEIARCQPEGTEETAGRKTKDNREKTQKARRGKDATKRDLTGGSRALCHSSETSEFFLCAICAFRGNQGLDDWPRKNADGARAGSRRIQKDVEKLIELAAGKSS